MRTVPERANAWEPVSGIEPLTCRLQEVWLLAADALAAQTARVIALTPSAALELSDSPFHESFHGGDEHGPKTVTKRSDLPFMAENTKDSAGQARSNARPD